MDILRRMVEMSDLERNLLLENIHEKGHGRRFLALLKGADPSARQAVYDVLPDGLREYVHGAVDRMGVPSEGVTAATEDDLAPLWDDAVRVAREVAQHEEEHRRLIRAAREVFKAGADAGLACVSDQMRGIPMPPPQKAYAPDARLIDLPQPERSVLRKPSIYDCIADRKSRRKYTEDSLSLPELAYLLWATQGVRKVVMGARKSYRTVPSGGARHPFETYLAVSRVEGLEHGVYRYLPFQHKLLYLLADDEIPAKLGRLAAGQAFVGEGAVCFIWSAIPYRTEWRYALDAKKDILVEAGHVCQNLYLACESTGCGTCGIAAYDQEGFDGFLGLDGEDEMVVYLAPVGRVTETEPDPE